MTPPPPCFSRSEVILLVSSNMVLVLVLVSSIMVLVSLKSAGLFSVLVQSSSGSAVLDCNI